MRILVVSNLYPPHYIGGYEISCADTVEFLKKNHDVVVLTGNYRVENQPEPGFIKKEPWRILKYIDYLNGNALDKHNVEKYNYKKTIEVLNCFKPDFVFFWNCQKISIAPVIAVQKRNLPVLFSIGDFWPDVYEQESAAAYIKRAVKNLLPGAVGGKLKLKYTLTPSEWVGKEVVRKYRAERNYVVPRSVHIPESINRAESNTVRYISCGRIEPRKGYELAIDAFSNLEDKNFTFHIYGNGDEEYVDFLKNLVREKNLDDRVELKGKAADIATVYEQNDVLVFSSLATETFGRVVIEAMSYGMTVIVPDRYGASEIITNMRDGVVFEYGNAESLLSCIRNIHFDHELISLLAKSGRETVKNKFNYYTVQSEIEKIVLEEFRLQNKRSVR